MLWLLLFVIIFVVVLYFIIKKMVAKFTAAMCVYRISPLTRHESVINVTFRGKKSEFGRYGPGIYLCKYVNGDFVVRKLLTAEALSDNIVRDEDWLVFTVGELPDWFMRTIEARFYNNKSELNEMTRNINYYEFEKKYFTIIIDKKRNSAPDVTVSSL